MRLIFDDYGEYWVWVDEFDENLELSPYFDEEDFAIEWQKHIKKILIGK